MTELVQPELKQKMLADQSRSDETENARDAAKRAMQAFVKSRRRLWRLTVLGSILMLSWPAWKVVNLPLMWTTAKRTYDVSLGVELEVQACDVDFVPGDAPEIKYAVRGLQNYKASWRSGGDGLNMVSSGTLANPAGCGSLVIDESCRRKCVVTVSVPSEAASGATFKIFQDPADKFEPLVRVWPGTELYELSIGSSTRKPKTMSLLAEGAAFKGALNTALGAGSVNVLRSTVSSSSNMQAGGPVYLQSVTTDDAPSQCSTGSAAAAAFKGLQSSYDVTLTTPSIPVEEPAEAPVEAPAGGERRALGSSAPAPTLGKADAKRLAQQYGEEYGDRDSTGNGYIVIDVAGLPSSATPVRFVYVTSPFFLQLDPAELSFLSVGMLSPTVINEEVYFSNLFSCDVDPNGPLPNATLAAMSSQLDRALHSDSKDEALLRGELVLIKKEISHVLWEAPQYLTFAPDGSQPEPDLYENPGLEQLVLIALVINGIFGLSMSLILTRVLIVMLKKMLRDAYKVEEAEYLISMQQMGYSRETILEDRENAGEDRQSPQGNPFMSPFVIITKFVVNPIRKQYVNSIQRFVTRRMRVVTADEAKKGFMYMRDFARAYELFCLENKLTAVTDRNAIQKELIETYECRVQQLRVDRLYGMRWMEAGEKQGKAAAAPTDKKPSLPELIEKFIDESFVVDGLPGSFVDFETRLGPDGVNQLGFRPEFTKYCEKLTGDKPPSFDIGDPGFTAALPKRVMPRAQIPVRQIRGLAWMSADDDSGGLSWSFYGMEALTVVVHLGMYLPALVMIYYAMSVQEQWGLSLMPPAHGKSPLLIFDLRTLGIFDLAYQLAMGESFVVLGVLKLFVLEAYGFMALTLLRQIVHYFDFKPSGFLTLIKGGYAWLLVFQLLLYSTFVGLFSCWFLLATVLNPGSLLPYGAALVTFVGVGTSTWTSLVAAADRVKGVIRDFFNKILMERVAAHAVKLRKEKEEEQGMMKGALTFSRVDMASSIDDAESGKGGKGGKGGKSAGKGGEGGGKVDDEEDAPPTPADLFAMINTDGDETVSAAEFRRLFKVLKLDVTEKQQEQLFALCDTDLSGELSEKEFVEGWDLMLDGFLEETAESMGLGTMQIVLAVLYLLAMFALAAGFILIGLAAWSSDSPFGAAVQAALVGGSGNASTKARKKGGAEDGTMKEVEKQVIEILAAQAKAKAED